MVPMRPVRPRRSLNNLRPPFVRFGVRLPGQLDLELALVGLDLELDLEVDLVGDVDVEADPVPLELDLVAAGEHVRQRMQPSGCLLAPEPVLLLDLDDLHGLSSV